MSAPALERFRQALLAEIKRTQPAATYNLVFITARAVEVAPPSITFVYDARPRVLAAQFEQLQPTLDALATRLAGRPMSVASRDEVKAATRATGAPDAASEKERLKAEAMREPVVQTLLEVFPADIRDVQEIDEK